MQENRRLKAFLGNHRSLYAYGANQTEFVDCGWGEFHTKVREKVVLSNVWDAAIACRTTSVLGYNAIVSGKAEGTGLSEILGQGSIRQIDAGLMLAAR